MSRTKKYDNFKLSIIIPVYNSYKFLKKMFESIATQTFKDFEVIILDDGSTDLSINIIKKYSQKFNNWFFFKLNHKGVSYIRSLGLIIAAGEYISFIDSDDFIEPSFLETLYIGAKSTDSDIAICGYKIFFSKFKFIFFDLSHYFHLLGFKNGVYDSKKIIGSIVIDIRLRSYFWNKIFKRKIFFDNDLIIPQICFEDMGIMLQIFYFSNKIFIEKNKLYNYRINSKGLSGGKMTKQKMCDYIYSFELNKIFLTFKNCVTNKNLKVFFLKIKISLSAFLFFIEQIFLKFDFLKEFKILKINIENIWNERYC